MENEQLYAVRDTGQIVVDNDRLRIGVGNFMQETYTNQSEEQLSGATAGLWLFFRDSPSSDYQFRVYQGLTFEKGGYVIRIIEINKDDGVVVIGVAPSSQ